MAGVTRSRWRAGFAALGAIAVLGGAVATAADALPNTSSPKLQLNRTIHTNPFTGTSTRMHDGEGSAYVAADDSLWLADHFMFPDHEHPEVEVPVFDCFVALGALAATMQQEDDTLEDVVEPYLLHEGFILRTPAGRRATPKSYAHLQIAPRRSSAQQRLLLEEGE